jgi:cation:H+ antiporter
MIQSYQHKTHTKATKKQYATKKVLLNVSKVIICLLALTLLSDLIIKIASNLALQLNFSELTIGITIVALGTSLPELITSLVAAYNKKYNLLIATIIGSNIANSSIVLGLSSFFHNPKFSMMPLIHALVCMIFTLMFSFMILKLKRINRVWGGILLLGYLTYVAFLIW